MSDQAPFPGPNPENEQQAEPPPRRACPRCRGTFEGSPDACPHCGLSKTEAATLNSQSTITAPLDPPSPEPGTPPAFDPASTEPATGTEPMDGGSKSRRWLLAIPLVLILLAGGIWWMTQGSSEPTEVPAEGDCSSYREELLDAQNDDYENSREQRRAVGEVIRRARDAGCDAEDLESAT